MAKGTLAVIIGNRDFFPERSSPKRAATSWRSAPRSTSKSSCSAKHDTKLGAVETWQHAKACADLFSRHRDRIDGVLVCLPNFGDEKGVADALQARRRSTCPCWCRRYPDDLDQLHVAAAPRCVLRQDLGLQQPAPIRHPVQPDRTAHRSSRRHRRVPRRAAEVPGRLPGRPRPAPGAHRRHRRAAERVQHDALQREAARGDRHQRQHARPVGSARRRAPTERRRPRG